MTKTRTIVVKPWMVLLAVVAASGVIIAVTFDPGDKPAPQCRIGYAYGHSMVVPVTDDAGYVVDYETQECQ
jgi:hypothetical protein